MEMGRALAAPSSAIAVAAGVLAVFVLLVGVAGRWASPVARSLLPFAAAAVGALGHSRRPAPARPVGRRLDPHRAGASYSVLARAGADPEPGACRPPLPGLAGVVAEGTGRRGPWCGWPSRTGWSRRRPPAR
ncbi:hypothetical protein HBB16_18155 [Pseudonocardia sp. MCCB 268]|nr:hypothetical protein [Pseudonocardia cytotoxica]